MMLVIMAFNADMKPQTFERVGTSETNSRGIQTVFQLLALRLLGSLPETIACFSPFFFSSPQTEAEPEREALPTRGRSQGLLRV